MGRGETCRGGEGGGEGGDCTEGKARQCGPSGGDAAMEEGGT